MRNQQVTAKPGFIACATLGLFLLSGGIGTMALADETIPEGFKKGELASEPPADVIEAGKRVYFTKCVWCHGVDGAGDGPGADRLWPRPRNFNQGTFKIRHTASGELPLYSYSERSPDSGKNDLLDTVTHGLPGSAMPPWEGILTEEQRVQVLAFVTTQLVKDRKFNDKETESQTILQLGTLNPVAPTEESIKKGAELVVEKKCIECHGVDGRGDGNAFNLKDDWGFSIQPADWHKCWNFRGSRQDPYNVRNIFRTFSTGLNGTPMPSFADNTTIEERWHIANFVSSLCERDVDGKTPLPIDPLTDKPKVNFVIPSAPIEGEISDDPANEMWQKQGRRIVAMGGQITHKPRNFVNRIDDIWVKSLYNEKNVVYLLQWDDRTKSLAEGKLKWAPVQVNVENFGVKEQAPKTGEEGSIAAAQSSYAVYNDAIGMQFPIKWQEIPAPFKPRYLWGDAKFHADIVKWEADGSLRSFRGTGWDQDFEERDDFEERMKLMKAEWKNGQWTVMISRPLGVKKDDYDEYTRFDVGQYIPTVFYAWDGHNGDAGRKMAVSAFYYTILEPPIPREVYIYPALIAFGVVILEGWVLTRRANKKRGKG